MGKYITNGTVGFGASIDHDDAVREVANLLGVGTRADGMYRLADICQAKSVNIWSRRGPFAYPAFHFDSDEARNNAKASIKHGIVPYALTTQEKNQLFNGMKSNTLSYPDIYTDSNRGWTMSAKPTGDASAPNRIKDFDGYYHLQVPTLYPIEIYDADDNYKGSLQDLESLDFFGIPSNKRYLDLVASGAEYSVAHIPLSELSDTINNLYAGVVIRYRATPLGETPSYTADKVIVGDRLGVNGEFRVRLDYSDLHKGSTYRILPVLFGNTSTPSAFADRVVYMLPQEPIGAILIKSSELEYSVIVGAGQAVAGQNGMYKFNLNITIYNPSENGIIVHDNFIRVGPEGGLISQTIALPDNIGLRSNDPYHTTVEATVQTFSNKWTLPVFFSLNGGEYTHDITF